MALIIRLDVDRPYGKSGLFRHVLSRIGTDLYFPRLRAFGYLAELKAILGLLNQQGIRACVFFRRCTFPSGEILDLMREGRHETGLHLENSRSMRAFQRERRRLERHMGNPVIVFSKHGSGRRRLGIHHHAPYEPEKYCGWALKEGMRIFFGNLEDPSLEPIEWEGPFRFFPSAFWLEPAWRDVQKYSVEWLCDESRRRDIVLLFHPDNIFSDASLMNDLFFIMTHAETKLPGMPSMAVAP